MKTLTQFDNNDIGTTSDGTSLAVSSGVDAYATILEDAIRTLRGEIQLDDSVGVDYLNTVFENDNNILMWQSDVVKKVRSYDFVVNIKSFTYELSGRKLAYKIEVETNNGTVSVSSGSEYERVNWISTDSRNTCFDTGVLLSDYPKISIQFQLQDRGMPFGFWSDNETNKGGILLYNTNGVWVYGTQYSSVKFSGIDLASTPSNDLVYNVVFDFTNFDTSLEWYSGWFENTSIVFPGRRNISPTGTHAVNVTNKIRLYGYKVWVKNELFINAVPVNVNGEGWMYDLKRQSLMTKIGSGKYIFG